MEKSTIVSAISASSASDKSLPAFSATTGRAVSEPHGAGGEQLSLPVETGQRLAHARAFIEAHFADNIGLADMAAATELSVFHFARCFKRETGVAPHHYLMSARVERAKAMLAETSLTLSEIARACGFAGQSHFTTAFGRHTGVTPGAWRSALRR